MWSASRRLLHSAGRDTCIHLNTIQKLKHAIVDLKVHTHASKSEPQHLQNLQHLQNVQGIVQQYLTNITHMVRECESPCMYKRDSIPHDDGRARKRR